MAKRVLSTSPPTSASSQAAASRPSVPRPTDYPEYAAAHADLVRLRTRVAELERELASLTEMPLSHLPTGEIEAMKLLGDETAVRHVELVTRRATVRHELEVHQKACSLQQQRVLSILNRVAEQAAESMRPVHLAAVERVLRAVRQLAVAAEEERVLREAWRAAGWSGAMDPTSRGLHLYRTNSFGFHVPNTSPLVIFKYLRYVLERFPELQDKIDNQRPR